MPDQEEKVHTIMERNYGAKEIKWSTKVSSESSLQTALIMRLQKIIAESEAAKQASQ